jgi:hypothetical protein
VFKPCPKCKEECEGVDLGDHPCWLTFECECGYMWGQNCIDDFTDDAMMRKEQ